MLKKYGLLILIFLVLGGMLIAVLSKDKIYDLIARGIQKQSTETEHFNAEKYVRYHFNYAENKQDFQFTLLEFKSTGCTICKQMEPILQELKNWDAAKVNVLVIQIMNPDSQEMMKYFGISAVPTHVLLDVNGSEIFRKYGFIPLSELENKVLSNL